MAPVFYAGTIHRNRLEHVEDHKYFLLRMGYRQTYMCTESVTADRY